MKLLTWLMLAAALLPFVIDLLAKAGGRGYDNNDPRAWLDRQAGWRARANAAQVNTFEALPFFFAALLFALHNGAPAADLVPLVGAWLGVRAVYVGMYVAGWGTARSLIWTVALALNIALLFTSGP